MPGGGERDGDDGAGTGAAQHPHHADDELRRRVTTRRVGQRHQRERADQQRRRRHPPHQRHRERHRQHQRGQGEPVRTHEPGLVEIVRQQPGDDGERVGHRDHRQGQRRHDEEPEQDVERPGSTEARLKRRPRVWGDGHTGRL
ncbi:hypothetical protein GCM10020001_020760 [Nonomuraea salmonea]